MEITISDVEWKINNNSVICWFQYEYKFYNIEKTF